MPLPRLKWIALVAIAAVAATPCHALGGFAVTNIPVGPFAGWTADPAATTLVGDFNGDGLADLALPGYSATSLPVAFSNGDGSFEIIDAQLSDPEFRNWARLPGVRAYVGDFNGDGRADIALTGNSNWGSVPIAMGQTDNTFQVINKGTDFAYWSSLVGGKVAVADFNHDGKSDLAVYSLSIALLPVAFSDGSGGFTLYLPASPFPPLANNPSAKLLIGDFNGDHYADLAATGVPGWNSIPVALSNGNGTFGFANSFLADFPPMAALANAQAFAGDFDDNGMDDIGVTGASGQNTIPLALATGGGNFRSASAPSPDFAALAATPGARVLTADFNHDGNIDLGLTGPTGWVSIPVDFGLGDGTFLFANKSIVLFAGWSSTANALPRLGDFNGDQRPDVTLTGVPTWASLPIAFSLSGTLP